MIEQFDPLKGERLQVVDGAEAARFTKDLIRFLEAPEDP